MYLSSDRFSFDLTFRKEVLVANNVFSGQSWSHCLKSFCLSGSTSVMASTTRSALLSAGAASVAYLVTN